MYRLAWVALLLAAAYALALWQPVRAWYSDVDKLAHGLVFAGVFTTVAIISQQVWSQVRALLSANQVRPLGPVAPLGDWPDDGRAS